MRSSGYLGSRMKVNAFKWSPLMVQTFRPDPDRLFSVLQNLNDGAVALLMLLLLDMMTDGTFSPASFASVTSDGVL